MKFSIYTYAFNCFKREFDINAAIDNFTKFADEVVVSTLINQEDNTLKILKDKEQNLKGKLKIIEINIDVTKNNRFDGDLKTEALKNCTNPIRIIADCDERFVLSQRDKWNIAAENLLEEKNIDGWFIPVIDLYKDRSTIRADKHIGLKMRMHKDTVTKRGVPFFAERFNGLFDTSKSDSTEPLIANGSLANFGHIVNPSYLHPSTCNNLPIYVIHEGFLDLDRRAKIGREFWKDRWEERSGHNENVATTRDALEGFPLIKHNLRLD